MENLFLFVISLILTIGTLYCSGRFGLAVQNKEGYQSIFQWAILTIIIGLLFFTVAIEITRL